MKFPQQKQNRRLELESIKTHACFLALDLAADSLFLIIRLWRRSLELFPDWVFFCPDEDRNESNRVFGETPSMALQCPWWEAIASRYWNSELALKLRTVGGGMVGVEAKRPMAMSGWSMTVLGGVSLEVLVRKSSRIISLRQLGLLFGASSLVEGS